MLMMSEDGHTTPVPDKPKVPRFESEAEEAQWWDQHREETAQWVEEAVAAGKTTTLSDVLERARGGYRSPL